MFVQALRKPNQYLNDKPSFTNGHLLALGDFNGDLTFDDSDARAFIDTLATNPVPGLSKRFDGFVAFDAADSLTTFGDGDGNFFNTTIVTGAPYQAGDSIGDLTAVVGFTDGVVDDIDIDWLTSAIAALSNPTRFDVNSDGQVDPTDTRMLVTEILDTVFGDVTLDGSVDSHDLAALRTNEGSSSGARPWHLGNVTGDGSTDETDLAVIRFNYGSQSTFLSSSVPEPSLTWLVAVGLPLILESKTVRRGRFR